MKYVLYAFFIVALFSSVPIRATSKGKLPRDEHVAFVVNYKLFKLCLTDDEIWTQATAEVIQADTYLQGFKSHKGEVKLDTSDKCDAYTKVIEYHNAMAPNEELSLAAREWQHVRSHVC